MITTQKESLKRRRRRNRIRIAGVIIAVVFVIGICFGAYYYFAKVKPSQENETETDLADASSESSTETESETEETEESTDAEIVYVDGDISYTEDELLEEAERLAAGYDYDAAIELVQNAIDAGLNDEYLEDYEAAIAEFEEEESQLVKWADNTAITHIFFHTLIYDTDKAFDGDYDSSNYNQVMTTVDEFMAIMEEMYNRGYVLVSIYDVAAPVEQEDGSIKMVKQDIYLPEGKTPFVLSQDDVSYYEYMTGDGFANRLVVTEDGTVTCEMDLDDGTSVQGSFDLIPLLEDFIAEHPDFSYKGARGTIALTGYNGVFGYRTSEYNYGTADTDHDSYLYLNENIEEDRETATEVANALKEMGWTFACHGWGHKAMGEAEYDSFVWDIDKWIEEVVPIIGETDILIYPDGDDVGSWREYTDEQQSDDAKAKYAYLKSVGFNYFCNVDGSKEYWVQINSEFVRMGRRNVDGTRMYEAVVGYRDLLSDLFDSTEIFDSARPTPVEGVTIPETTEATESSESENAAETEESEEATVTEES